MGDHVITFIVSDGLLTDQETVTITVPAPDASGITAISSRLLDATDFLAGIETPIADAEVSIAGQNIFATTAADGSFTLTATEAGTQTLQLVPAPGTLAPDGSPYAEGREAVALISGVTTLPDDPFLLLRLPAGACQPVVAGLPTQVAPAGLGVTLDLEADAAAAGSEICLAEVPTEIAQNLLPPLISPCQLLTVQAFSLEFAPAGTLSLPNLDSLPAGATVDIWTLSGDAGGALGEAWSIAGQGTVSADASAILSDGELLTGGGYFFAVPPLPMLAQSADYNPSNVTPTALKDGNFSTSVTTPAYRSLEQERAVTLVYNSALADPRPIVAADATLTGHGALPVALESSLSLGGLKVAGPISTATANPDDPADPGLDPDLPETLRLALQFDAGTLPTGSYTTTFQTTAAYDCSRVGAELPGRLLVENRTESPFGSGWTLAGLQSLALREDGNVVLTDGTGQALFFELFSGVEESGEARELISAPNSVLPGARESDGEIVIFNEVVDLTLTAPLALNATNPRLYDSNGDLNGGSIAAGAVVNSHLIHFDPVGSAGAVTRSASFVFQSDILGILVLDAQLDASDAVLGAAGTDYPNGQPRATDLSDGDRITLEGDLRTLSVTLTSAGGLDQLRVITSGQSDTLAAEGFDENDGGWRVVGDVNIPNYFPTGGNPGGHVQAVDRGTGIFWYWQAPLDFLGDRSELYNARLSYDLRQSSTSRQRNRPDLILTGAGLTLTFDTPYNPLTTWTHYSVHLQEGAGWVLAGTTTPPTASQFLAVLGDLTDFQIRGEFRVGADTGSLDNVIFVQQPPAEPVFADFRRPAGAFSTLSRNDDGSFSRRLTDGTTYAFDDQGRMTSVSDTNGNTTSYGYDPVTGALTKITDPAGLETLFAYGPDGLMDSVTDPAGRITTYFHDQDGNLVRILDPEEAQQEFAYLASGLMETATDQRGFDTDYDYGFAGQLIGADLPDGASISQSIFRDLGLANLDLGEGTPANPSPYARPGGLETTVTDGNGNLTRLKLDEFGGIIEIVDALGRTTTIERDEDGLPIRITKDSDGEVPAPPAASLSAATSNTTATTLATMPGPGVVVTELEYDENGNILVQREAVGTALERETLFEYEPVFNRVTKITDPGGFETRFDYDANGNLLKETDAALGEQNFTYDSRGLRLTARDQNDNLTTNTYNPDSLNLETVTDPSLTVSRMEYDLAGDLLKQIDDFGGALQRENNFAYDAVGRLTSITDGEQATTLFRYDAADNLVEVEDATGVVQTRTYDERNRSLIVDDPDTGLSSFTYDNNGNVIRQVDAAGEITTYDYDAANRLTKTIDPLLQERLFTYDRRDNITGVTDARGKATTFTYDLLDRMVGRENPLLETWAFAYDPRDNRTSSTKPDGVVLTAEFDALSRVISLSSSSSVGALGMVARSFGYDPASNLTSADAVLDGIDGAQLAFNYDQENRVSRAETRNLFGTGALDAALDYGYDALDRRISMTDSFGGAITYGYDRRDLLTELTTPQNNLFEFTYDPAERVMGRSAVNGTNLTRNYEPLTGRLAAQTQSAAGLDFNDLAYGYTGRGNVESIAETGTVSRTRTYSHDELERLTNVTAPGRPSDEESYVLDEEGNRTTSHLSPSHLTDDANRLTEDDSHTYSYDPNGNLIAKTAKDPADPSWSYAYDALDQLLAVSRDGALVEEYRYDGLSRRSVIATVDEASVAMASDGRNRFIDLIEDSGGSARLQARYSHGANVDEPLQMENFDSAGALSGRYTYHADHLGSVRFLTDEAGNIANEYDYDSYGNRLTSVEAVAQPFSFTGREWNEASETYDYRARVYDPQTGRFLQEDPIWFSTGDLNLYRYVWNNPLSWTDPTGLVAASERASSDRTALGLIGPLAAIGQRVACIFGTVAGVLNAINEVNGDPSVTLQSVEVLSAACGARAIVKKKRRKVNTCKAPSRGPGRFLSAFFSFPKGTLIWGENGFVPIEEIAVGDLVWSRDEKTGETELNRVTENFQRQTTEMTNILLRSVTAESSGLSMVSTRGNSRRDMLHSVRLTPEHPVYVVDRLGDKLGWIVAGNLMTGDVIADIDNGVGVEVVANNLQDVEEEIYNFKVENAHSYFADELGLWVHNGDGAYIVRLGNGQYYIGKGGIDRARVSNKRLNGFGFRHFDACGTRESFILEDRLIEKFGGIGSDRLPFNQRNSPGKKFRGR